MASHLDDESGEKARSTISSPFKGTVIWLATAVANISRRNCSVQANIGASSSRAGGAGEPTLLANGHQLRIRLGGKVVTKNDCRQKHRQGQARRHNPAVPQEVRNTVHSSPPPRSPLAGLSGDILKSPATHRPIGFAAAMRKRRALSQKAGPCSEPAGAHAVGRRVATTALCALL